ncbi:hypothetical protein D7X74_08005 [Corallococcus sp. CA047B]|uniref:RCC1 domain-containing protein n=1 Tax=Corallococcus sp. CA047B TaxID=2316729 RepID=UPI000EA19107|nr:hypothetical protein [Corallococcus sp. CA047B]RKH18967.1 hypothetical protein D7X74_08005 [Corallococcus sp. CA047B]
MSRRTRRSALSCLLMGLAVALAGCSGEKAPAGSAQAVVTLPQSLAAADVVRVALTVSGAGMAPRTELMVRTGQHWGGTLNRIPEGSGLTFHGEAFDAAGARLHVGKAEGVSISTGQTTAVMMLARPLTPASFFENASPVITSMVVSPGAVTPGGVVSLQATAEDPDPDDLLTFAWTAGAGSFSAASKLSTNWTAPTVPGPVVLTLTVTDANGATAALDVTVTVLSGTGSAAVNVTVNTWPQVARMTATPSLVAVGEATTATVTATDDDGDSLGYQWTTSCQGTWSNATSASASFTPTVQPPPGDVCSRCALKVTVEDAKGGKTTGTLGLCVGPTTSSHVPPKVVETFQSVSNMPTEGNTVIFRVKVKDPQNSALSYAWTTNVGTLGTATQGATTSEVLWTAPACIPAATPLSVSVSVTNALGLSTQAFLSLKGGTTCPAVRDIRLASGALQSMFVKQDGTAWAWGFNGYGVLGDGTTTHRFAPVQVQGLSGVAAIAAGYSHTLALKQDGTLWAWGYNRFGQLGDGTTVDRSLPARVQGLTQLVDAAGGIVHTLALKEDGTVWAWGDNSNGQLGTGTEETHRTPTQTQGLMNVSALAAGYLNSLALKQDGTVWEWGFNSAHPNIHTPKQVQGLTGVIAIASGFFHSAAVKQDGTAWTWGENQHGQLGDGTTNIIETSPVQVLGVSNVIAVAAGDAHTVVLKQDGTVWAWGRNDYGQLGDGLQDYRRPTPVPVHGLTGVVRIAAGESFGLAVKQDGSLWAWGLNSFGRLGDGTETLRLTPVQVQGLSN